MNKPQLRAWQEPCPHNLSQAALTSMCFTVYRTTYGNPPGASCQGTKRTSRPKYHTQDIAAPLRNFGDQTLISIFRQGRMHLI